MSPRKRKFGRREIAFRPNKHHYTPRTMLMFSRIICEDLPQVLGIGLERSD
jgi:hypothetical protein